MSASLPLLQTCADRPTPLARERAAQRDAATLLTDLEARGIEVMLAGDDKVVARPKSLLNDRERTNLRQAKESLLDHMRAMQEQAEIERMRCLDAGLPGSKHPGYSIVRVCRRYGVALCIDSDGALVVGKAMKRRSRGRACW